MQNHSLYIHYTDEAQKAETVPIYLPLDETLLWQPQIYPLIEHCPKGRNGTVCIYSYI
jgi:hypothetical protein